MLRLKNLHQPASLREAIDLLGSGVAPIAGGTDFCVNPRFQTGIEEVVDLRRCGLSWIRRDGGALSIGATTTMHEVATSPVVADVADGILGLAAATCGSPNVRHVATLGGNSASSLPSADTPAVLLALDAAVVLEGRHGSREMPLSEFLVGPGKNCLEDELLVEFRVPGKHRRGAFQKLGRAADDISLVNAAVAMRLEESFMFDVRIVAGAVAPVSWRCKRAEAALEGQRPEIELLRHAARLVVDEIAPISDQRATAAYRRRTAAVLVRRALEQSCALS
ncbi:MAG: FAD binding domain-containing protein [Chloroflexi bacterium]|nr:FAD binding domain-containing protein [Chloroflexota bacterium]